MRIFVDMDDVLVELLDEWIWQLNNVSEYKRQKCDIKHWDMRLSYPDLSDKVLYGILNEECFWDNVKPVNDAYKYLKLLKEEGHEVYVATSSYPRPFSIKINNCLLKYYDFLTPKDLICIHNKSLLRGDVLFDDYHENLRNFKGVKVLKDAPYNRNCEKSCFHFRVVNWSEFYKIVKELSNVEGVVWSE
jgi:5'(3')-deoxyribonucleotidase